MNEIQNQNDTTQTQAPALAPERKPYEPPVLEKHRWSAVIGFSLPGGG
jgi:hypothetical protein